MSDNFLKDRICLVTGATRGIGRAIALALGSAGGTVIGTATSDSGAARIGEALADASITGAGMVLDVSSDESVNAVIERISSEFGTPAVLVNNAGITRDNLIMRMKESEWDDVIDTNLKSLYRVIKGFARPMTRARYGRIINISSVVAATGNAGQVNYASSKAGMIGFTRSLAHELAGRNILVNAVAPGFIETDMTDVLPEAQKQALLSHVPLGRLGSPEEVAGVVLFLASPSADYLTGQTIHVNGGMYMG
ncbi:MAG: 3-oxoacyl-ACP reductase FabG [Proteobacteria bacterium]|nr:MAG: 3-oxoacyl-ACP reductase FabG [Pseudomonadota bacterium]